MVSSILKSESLITWGVKDNAMWSWVFIKVKGRKVINSIYAGCIIFRILAYLYWSLIAHNHSDAPAETQTNNYYDFGLLNILSSPVFFTFQQGNKWQSQNICGGKASIYIELIISLFTVCLMRLSSNQLNCWQAIGIVASLSFSADNSTGTVCGS